MAVIKLKPGASSWSPVSGEKGKGDGKETKWRTGKDKRDRAKIVADLLRLEEVVLRQQKKLEWWGEIYNGILTYLDQSGHTVASKRLRERHHQYDTLEMREIRRSGGLGATLSRDQERKGKNG